MSILFDDIELIREDVERNFGRVDSFLVVVKQNRKLINLALLALSNSIYTFANGRKFILHFAKDGIYKKEISSNLKGEYTLLAWDDITELTVAESGKETIIEYEYKGSKSRYELPYGGRAYMNNRQNEDYLQSNHWHRFPENSSGEF